MVSVARDIPAEPVYVAEIATTGPKKQPQKIACPDGLTAGTVYMAKLGEPLMMFYNCPYWGYYLFHVFDPETGSYLKSEAYHESELPGVLYVAKITSGAVRDPYVN